MATISNETTFEFVLPEAPEPKLPSEFVFDDLIAPLSSDEFLKEYWQQKPVVTRGRPTDFFTCLFSVKDVDKVLFYQRPTPGRIDMVTSEGFVRDNYLNSDQTANMNLVYASYLKGSTLILGGLDESWPPLTQFSRNLESELHHGVGIGIYMTPPNAKGVKPHYDTQEGFLIQVEGSKQWKIYEPTSPFPPVEGSYTPVPRDQLKAPILETTLNPGDVLYMPRGFPHEGVSGDSGSSLHIPLEIHVRTWLDFISDALAAVAERDMRFRRSVPVSFLNQSKATEVLTQEFEQFKDFFCENASLDDAIRKHVEHLAVEKPPIPDGHFASLFANIELTTQLKKRKVSIARLIKEKNMVGLQFSGNHILGPLKIEEALEFICNSEHLTPDDLPGNLTSDEKLVLVKRLVKIGLLSVC